MFQKLATSEDFNCKDNLSAIRAMNSEFVGFPFVLETVYPKKRWRVSRSPLSQATSMAWRIARSTLEGVVWNVFATCGYNTLVMALMVCLRPTRRLPPPGDLLLCLCLSTTAVYWLTQMIAKTSIRVKLETYEYRKLFFLE